MNPITAFESSKNPQVRIQRSNNIECSLHIHEKSEMEIVIILQGEAECHLNSDVYKVHKDNVIVIFPNQPHRYCNSTNIDAVIIIFQSDLFEELHCTLNGYIPATPIISDSYFEKINFKNIIDNLLNDIPSDNIIMKKGYAALIISKLIPFLELKKKPTEDKSDFLELAKNFCYNNFTKSISLTDVAKYVNVSPNYLSYIFKHKFGMNFTRYINILKVTYACRLLSTTKLSISEIALKCGFASIRTFNRVFQKEVGATPLQYRNNPMKRH